LIFGLFINKLKFIVKLFDGIIILLSNLNIFFKQSNLPFPRRLFTKEIKGLLKIMEKTVPWNESVINIINNIIVI